ncbi:MAG: DUF4240 domain-containing protein [Cyclobacteriaceae bacterium]|nr:DUF4240 domain-containing protein [Cyclobacteriaceae bacterium]
MGILDNFFRSKWIEKTNVNAKADTSDLLPTAELLEEMKFWDIISKSIKSTKNQEDQEEFLIRELMKLSPKEIVGFRLRTDYLLYHSYKSEWWCAAYIMNGGCSDDGFEYFRCWVISRGRQAYEMAMANPDNLVDQLDKTLESYDFEGFWYVALNAFKRKTGKELYDYIDNAKFKMKEGAYPTFEFNWQEDNPESMKRICPRLFSKFNN